MRCSYAVACAGAALSVMVAFEGDVRAEVGCGSVTGSWNVPKGGLVMSRSDSVVGNALVPLEWKSHSMLSVGPGGGFHAALDPDSLALKSWPGYCSGGPVQGNKLRDGWPGMQIIGNASIYAYYFRSVDPLLEIFYQTPYYSSDLKRAEAAANWANYWSEWMWLTPGYDANTGRQIGRGYSLVKWNGVEQRYSLFQYKNIESRELGQVPRRSGAVCSTSIAWAFNMASRMNIDRAFTNDLPANTPTNLMWRIEAKNYPQTAAITVGNNIYHSASSSCDSGTWRNEFAATTCFESICDDLGRQVRNCMLFDKCSTDSDSDWNTFKRSSLVSGAYTLSPSRLGGWDNNFSENTVDHGPWSGFIRSGSVTWSGAGSTYGCWTDDWL